MGGKYLWVPEKKEGAIRFYRRHHFRLTGDKKPETGTEEYIVKMEVHMTEWEMGLEVHFPTSRAK